MPVFLPVPFQRVGPTEAAKDVSWTDSALQRDGRAAPARHHYRINKVANSTEKPRR